MDRRTNVGGFRRSVCSIAVSLVALLALGALAGCSDDDKPPASTTTTTEVKTKAEFTAGWAQLYVTYSSRSEQVFTALGKADPKEVATAADALQTTSAALSKAVANSGTPPSDFHAPATALRLALRNGEALLSAAVTACVAPDDKCAAATTALRTNVDRVIAAAQQMTGP